MGNTVSRGPPINKWQHVPRSATVPGPPGRPDVVLPPTDEYLLQYHQPDVITVRWKPPEYDGGTPLTGYLVERRDTAATTWVRAHAALTRDPEVNLAGLEPGRRYQFRVMAENALGFSEPSEPTPPISFNIGSVATVPHFLKELKDIVAAEHEKVTFSVQVLGTPTPQIAWYMDAYEIFNSKRIKIVTDNEHSSLTFFQVALSDESEIKCTATNRAGHIVTKGMLRVDAPPRVKFPKNYDEGMLFELGDVIRLKASISGRPPPIVYWLHNGEELQNDARCEIVHSEHSTTLRILDSKRDDRGEYVVRGSNDLGEDNAAVLVTVTDRPLPPGKPEIATHSGRTVRLEWRAPKDDGGCKIGNFTVEYYRIGWNVWLKAATCRQLGATLDDMIEGSEYKFRIKAENPYGMSDPSEESDTVFIPDPKRGLYKPPTKDPAADNSNVASDEWLEERRRKRAEMFGFVEPKPVEPAKPPPQQKEASPEHVEEEEEDEEDGEEEEEEEEESEYSDEEEELEEEEEEDEEEEIENEDGESRMHRGNSDELMVVLVPSKDKLNDAQSVTTESNTEQSKRPDLKQQDSMDMPPPPMSLSSPELSALNMRADEITPIQFQRNAVSSTELLHEKAMARLYQALAAEEARNEKKRQETMQEEDAVEMTQAPENILPRAKITDTGQFEEIKPPPSPAPEKPALKSVLKKPKRKIPEVGRSEDAKKNKTSDFEHHRTHTPVTFSESYKDVDIRPVSPYLRGPFLHRDHDYDDVEEMVISRPTTPRSVRSARSVSPFSRVVVMDKPPEGIVLEPSPPPQPLPPPKKQRIHRKVAEEAVDMNRNEVEVFKVPEPELHVITADVEVPRRRVLKSSLKKLPRRTAELDRRPEEDMMVVEKTEIVIESVEEAPKELQVKPADAEGGEKEIFNALQNEPVVSHADKRKGMIILDKEDIEENEPEQQMLKLEKPLEVEKQQKVEIPQELEKLQDVEKSQNDEKLQEAEKPQKAETPKKLEVEKPRTELKVPIVTVEPAVQPSPSPSKKKRSLISRLLSKDKKDVPPDESAKEEKVRERPPRSGKAKDKRNKKLEESASEEMAKEKKGLSILGVKLRRPTEMVRDEEGPDTSSRRKAFQQQTSLLRMSTESQKATEDAECRAIVVSRYDELIDAIDSGRRSASTSRRMFLDLDELKSQADGDEDPLEDSIHSKSPVDLKEEEDSSAKVKLLPGEEFEEETWEEDEISELPPSPPRSATPKHEWSNLQVNAEEEEKPVSKAKSISRHSRSATQSGEAAKETLTKATNIAIGLFVVWLSIRVDWHLGLGVVCLYLLHRVYVWLKLKFLQLTGLGELKKRERSPEFEPGDDVPDPDPLPGLALLAPPPPTPPISPSRLMHIIPEEDEEEGVDEEDGEEEEALDGEDEGQAGSLDGDELMLDEDGNLVRARVDYDYDDDEYDEDELLEEELLEDEEDEEDERLKSIPYRYTRQPD